VNGHASSWSGIPSGVPQGSLLGPLMFNIFINDIGTCFRSSDFLLYADDMKVYRKVNSSNDCQMIQEDLLRLEEYCHLNKLDLNVSKCFAMTFTHKTTPVKFTYQLIGTNLANVDEFCDLGVTHDRKLS
ncbi:hypothetical protein F3H14_37965, partial [Pseudomonas aeruginosa]